MDQGVDSFKSGPFLYRMYKDSMKESNVLHHVNNIEHNLNQNINTGIKLPP